jgi:hypothetical protein
MFCFMPLHACVREDVSIDKVCLPLLSRFHHCYGLTCSRYVQLFLTEKPRRDYFHRIPLF